MKNFIAESTNDWNSASERSAGRSHDSRKPWIKRIQASFTAAFADREILGVTGKVSRSSEEGETEEEKADA